MEQICEICHDEPATHGFKLCDRCKGFDPLSASKELPKAEAALTRQPPTETTLNLCETCGGLIEPYKLGRQTRTKGECRTCYHKRRYGPDHKPGGGMTKEEKAAKYKEWRAKKKANGGNGGSETLQPGTSEPNMDKCNMVRQANNLPEMPPQKQPKATAEALSTLNIKMSPSFLLTTTKPCSSDCGRWPPRNAERWSSRFCTSWIG